MGTLHLVLLVVSVGCLVLTAAAGHRLARIDSHLPMLGVVVGGALAIGNAASLLPHVPAWYSAGLVVATIIGVAWLALAVASARTADDRSSLPRVAAATAPPGRFAEHVAHAAPRPLRAVLVAVPDPAPEPSGPAATQRTFDERGPRGGWATRGHGAYVATHVERYVDARGTRRAHGAWGPRRHDGNDPTARFLALARAYDIDHPSRPRRGDRGHV